MAALHLVLPPHILSGHGPPALLRFPRRPSPLVHLLPRAAVAATGASAAAAAVSAPSDAALQNFRRWLSTHGADTGAVVPAVVPEGLGLGLVAARNLPRGEVVAEVPKKLWMDADAVASSDIGRVCSSAGDLRPWVSVSLLILREAARGGDSLWAPYLAILPRQTDSTIFW
jgi:[ribulose-bisphosphate carboxylase]-lysine N-methyltransferase